MLLCGHEVCGILAPCPGIKLRPPASEGEVFITGPSRKSLNLLSLRKEGLPSPRESEGIGSQWCEWPLLNIQTAVMSLEHRMVREGRGGPWDSGRREGEAPGVPPATACHASRALTPLLFLAELKAGSGYKGITLHCLVCQTRRTL